MRHPNPSEIRTFGDYLDRLNAQARVEDVEEHIDDWPGGRKDRAALISYALDQFGQSDVLYRWAKLAGGRS